MKTSIQAVLFDFDGTLTHPGSLNFKAIRQAIGIFDNTPILEHIANLPSGTRRAQAEQILNEAELAAARQSFPNHGAEALLCHLRQRQIPFGILTRNSLRSVQTALRNFQQVTEADFGIIVTRESKAPPKPSPAGVLLAAEALQTKPGNLLMVGDFIFDIEAGQQAGALTAFLVSTDTKIFPDPPADFTIHSLTELSRNL